MELAEVIVIIIGAGVIYFIYLFFKKLSVRRWHQLRENKRKLLAEVVEYRKE